MRAVVQYNRRQLLAQGSTAPPAAALEATSALQAAAAAATLDTQQQQQEQQQQQQQQQQPPLVVGYVMKPSREDALAKSGMLHLLFKEGLCFMPVDLHSISQQQQQQDQQQQQQQQHIDILLHKGSDELLPLEASSSAHNAAEEAAGAGESAGPAAAVGVCWSPRLLALQNWLRQHPSVCVVDPFEHTAKVQRVQQPAWG
jgi:flagellar motor protein MotB